MNAILIIVLGLLFLGVLPIWSHSGNWGYLPSSGLGFLLLVLVMLTMMGRTERSVAGKL
jgi:uncharacterized membrane protein